LIFREFAGRATRFLAGSRTVARKSVRDTIGSLDSLGDESKSRFVPLSDRVTVNLPGRKRHDDGDEPDAA